MDTIFNFTRPRYRAQNLSSSIFALWKFCLFFLICINGYSTKEVTLKLEPLLYDDYSETVYIGVSIKYEGNDEFVLADQNYRIYYDSQLLSVNKKRSRSDLPDKLYTKMEFSEVLENLKAGFIGDLSFDNNLGFINFNMDLKDVVMGGLTLGREDEWLRVAILNFKVHDKLALSNVIWSASGKTDRYATAFVEIMEWVGPNHTEHVDVIEHIDANFSVAESVRNLNVQVSPNPAIEFVRIDFDLPVKHEVVLSITDAIGRRVFEQSMNAGLTATQLNISELSPGTYNLEIYEDGLMISSFHSAFVKVRS